MLKTTPTGRIISKPEPQLRLPGLAPRTPFGIALREKLRKERGEIGDTPKLLNAGYANLEMRVLQHVGYDRKTESIVDWLRRNMGLPKKKR